MAKETDIGGSASMTDIPAPSPAKLTAEEFSPMKLLQAAGMRVLEDNNRLYGELAVVCKVLRDQERARIALVQERDELVINLREVYDNNLSLDAALQSAEAERDALLAVHNAAAEYRKAEQDGTPRLWKGKDLCDLADALDKVLAAAPPAADAKETGR